MNYLEFFPEVPKMNPSNRLHILGAMLLLIALSITTASAQSFKATVVGQITDSNGASVPSASVTITEKETGRTQTVTTNQDGNFTITQLPPGRYDLAVEAPNFKKLLQSDLVLETDQTQRVNLVLEVGDVNEQVTIVGDAPVINTDTSDKSEVITTRQVQELPLNGRDFTDLALLTPGVYRRPADDDQGQGLAVAGTRTDSTNFILDGVGNRSDRGGSVGVNTSVDSIREFKVATSTYTAEFGRTAGAQINVVSKSGTNDFHGSAFDFIRNDRFDADNYFTGEKKLRRNQFGGTIGGPITIPSLYSGRDRTFFFVSYEGTRETRSRGFLTTAPNAAWLQGDFRNVRGAGPDKIFGNTDDTNRILRPVVTVNPSNGRITVTRVEFPTPNVIPQDMIDPVSKKLLAFIPAANDPGSQTGYLAGGVENSKRNLFSTKIDHRFSDKNNFYASYAQQFRTGYDPFPSLRNFYPGFGRDIDTKYYNLALSDTHIFSPSVINEFRFGTFYQDNKNLGEHRDADVNAQLGIPFPNGYSPGEALQGFPAIRIDGFSEFGDRPNDPFIYTIRNFQFYDVVSLVKGNHSMKFGVDILTSNYVEADVRNVRGDFRFRGRSTNPSGGAAGSTSSGFRSFADFLLGLPEATQLQFGAQPTDLRGTQYAFFIQDDWKVHPRLTLNLGLRYEVQQPLTEKNGRLGNFIPELREVVLSGDPRFPKSLVETDKNNFGPRIGFAYRPFDDRTVIRGGAGIYYSLETFNPIRQQLAVTYPFVDRREYARLLQNTSATATARNPVSLTFGNPFPGGTQGSQQGVGEPFGLQVDYKQPEFYQYNLTLEREIVQDLAFEIGYVGSLGRHLGRRYNLNQSTPVSATVTGNTFTLTTQNPYPQFGEIQYQEQTASSSYNSLQTSLRRRSRNGLTLLVSYTFSRAIDNASSTNNSSTGTQKFPQNVYDFASEKALSDFHRKHQFSASFNYELPFGRGRAFFGDARGIGQALAGGWQVNGIWTVLSGRPFTPQYSSPDVGQQRPDLIGDPYANVPAGLFFNPDAFGDPSSLSSLDPANPSFYGNAGRNILIGPGFNSFDFSVLKNINLGEGVKLQLRAEAFNILNHPNFQVPVFLLDNANVGKFNATANEGREMQFAIKLLF